MRQISVAFSPLLQNELTCIIRNSFISWWHLDLIIRA